MRGYCHSLQSFIHHGYRWFVVFGLVALTACAPSTMSDRPAGGRDILIVTGEGFVPHYRDARDPVKIEKLWKTVAERYAQALAIELRKGGHRARVHVNLDKGKKASEIVPYLLVGRNHDALIQVRISHVKNTAENTVYLISTWLALRYERLPDGRRSAITGNEIERKEPMLRTDGPDRRSDSISVMAREFVELLRGKDAI